MPSDVPIGSWSMSNDRTTMAPALLVKSTHAVPLGFSQNDFLVAFNDLAWS